MKQLLRFIFLFIIIGTSCSSRHDIGFDSEQWKKWEETETTACVRWDMRKDLVKQHKLIGLSREQIIDLLGEPDSRYQSENEIRYYLGMARVGIDTGTLILTLKNNIVIEYEFWHG